MYIGLHLESHKRKKLNLDKDPRIRIHIKTARILNAVYTCVLILESVSTWTTISAKFLDLLDQQMSI